MPRADGLARHFSLISRLLDGAATIVRWHAGSALWGTKYVRFDPSLVRHEVRFQSVKRFHFVNYLRSRNAITNPQRNIGIGRLPPANVPATAGIISSTPRMFELYLKCIKLKYAYAYSGKWPDLGQCVRSGKSMAAGLVSLSHACDVTESTLGRHPRRRFLYTA